MANTRNGYVTEKQTIERVPCLLVFDCTFDTTGALKLTDLPPKTIILDSWVDVYQAEAGATDSKVDLRTTDGTTPVTVNTGASDNLGATGKKAGTPAPKAPMADDGVDRWLEANVAVTGTDSTPAKARVNVWAMRSAY